MNFKSLTLLLLAALAAMGAVVSANSWFETQQSTFQASNLIPEVKAPETREILVADKDLPSGLLIQTHHLSWKPWPKNLVKDHMISRNDGQNLDDFVGRVVRSGIAEDEPIAVNRLIKPEDRGFLAAVLNPGMRAISVPVNETTGISGFVFPGDRVDLILTHGIDQEDGYSRLASETVLSGVRVLAVDQNLEDQENEPDVAETVTLEVTPKEAEKVTLMQDLGRLFLSLQSLARPEVMTAVNEDIDADADTAADNAVSLQRLVPQPEERTIGYTWENEVSPLLNVPCEPKFFIVRGSEVVTQSF